MNDFEEAINSDLNWRLGEIAILKSLTVQSHLSERKKAIARKYSIPALYAVWEGYIVSYQLAKIIELDWNSFLKHKKWHSRMAAWHLIVSKKLLTDATIIFDNQ